MLKGVGNHDVYSDIIRWENIHGFVGARSFFGNGAFCVSKTVDGFSRLELLILTKFRYYRYLFSQDQSRLVGGYHRSWEPLKIVV